MRADVLQRLGLGALERVKGNPTYPYKTGNLKNNATKISFIGESVFIIYVDKIIAPYVKYLEYGTESGEYTDKKGNKRFFRGQSKHVGFLSVRATNDIIQYLSEQFHRLPTVTLFNNEGKRFNVK